MANRQLGLFERVPSKATAGEIYAKADIGLVRQCLENSAFERKPAGIHSNELAEYLSMWANTKPDGGLIAVGVENNGDVSGCRGHDLQHINNLEKAGYKHCPEARAECKKVPFEHDDRTEDYILLWRVPYRPDKLVRHVNGKAYRREGDSKTVIREGEAIEIEREKGQSSFEQEVCAIAYPDGFDVAAVRTWTATVKLSKKWDETTSDEQVMANLHLGTMRDGHFVPSMACALLFAKDPASVVPGCKIHLLRFQGEVEGTGETYSPSKDEFIEGTVPRLIVDSAKWIESQLRTFTRQGEDGKFYTSPEYPKLAWYEALVNACVHRSYGLRNTNISVKVFADKIVVESPGGFPPFVTPENIFDIPSTPRNPHLFQAMWFLEYVRCNNEGVKRIRDNMASMNLPAPEFKEHERSFISVRVTLKNNVKHRRVWVDADAAALIGKALFEELTQDERRVINFVAEYEKVNVSEVQRLTQLTWPQAKRLLVRLEKRGIVAQVRKPGDKKDPYAHFILRKADPPK